MYKDDNITFGACNDALLRAVLSGGGNQVNPPVAPSPKPDCGCENTENSNWGLTGYPLASVYAPLQKFENLYDEKKGLSRGTIFSELDLPFEGKTVKKGGNCCG